MPMMMMPCGPRTATLITTDPPKWCCCSLLSLDANGLVSILRHLDNPQDLLRLSRTCIRLSAVVQHEADLVWQQLFHATYPNSPLPAQPAVCYRQLFKDRWIRDAKELRLQRRVQRMRLQSDVAQLQRELHALHERLQAEHKLQQSLEQQLREVQRARLADSQAGQWQLGAVKLYTNRIVQAAPVGVEAKLADLQQQQKVCRLQARTLKSSIDLHRQRLADTKRRLAAHEG